MPGPVSDSYDPEFGTGQNAADISRAIREVVGTISAGPLGGKPVKNIVDVVNGPRGARHSLTLNEREWRIVRFAMNRALESI